MTYQQNHVKREPESGAVAIRTFFDESNPQLAGMAWLVVTSTTGARHCRTAEVADWEDLYVP